VKIRLGTRGSRLALVQSQLFARRLRDAGHEVELVPIVTEGDVRPVDMSPGEGVFVAAIARALIGGEIEIAVHSAKDIPLEEEPELVVAAYPERADPRDALITRTGDQSLDTLPPGSTVGTDSPRRTGFVRAARPDLEVVPLHGNVETRLRRLDNGDVDALVLAAAGIDRLGRNERIDQRLDPDVLAPAPAQGALAVQSRRADADLIRVLATHDVRSIRLAVETEREVLRATGGTCRAPVGALAVVENAAFTLLVAGVNSDGTGKHVEHIKGASVDARELAVRPDFPVRRTQRHTLRDRRCHRHATPTLLSRPMSARLISRALFARCNLRIASDAGNARIRGARAKASPPKNAMSTITPVAASVAPGMPWGVVFAWLCATEFFAVSWPSPFWVLPTLALSESAAAVAIGVINICANLAGLIGSPVVGEMKHAGYGDRACLLFLAACYACGGVIISLLRVPRTRGRPVEPAGVVAAVTDAAVP